MEQAPLRFYSPDCEAELSFKEGYVILVDKPLEWTSFDVVSKVRNLLSRIEGVKRIKVGHAGTLDPLASGLLIICCGKYTKKLESFQAQEKQYSGTIQLGATRPSYDMETEIDTTFPVDHLNEEDLHAATAQFVGEIMQKPPVFSAIKQGGERLYKKARRGEEVEVKARQIKVTRFDVQAKANNQVDFILDCSKGTYVRSLAYDYGNALNTGGYLAALRRESIGDFSVDNAWSLDALIDTLQILKDKRNKTCQ